MKSADLMVITVSYERDRPGSDRENHRITSLDAPDAIPIIEEKNPRRSRSIPA